MSEIFGAALMGGGSGPAYAAISVTYPAGATCTCALGSKTLTAPDTSGQALFIVPTAGEWGVSISQSGQQTKSVPVNITQFGQIEAVSITFRQYIYNEGNQYTSITGGWASRGWAATASSAGGDGPQISQGESSMTIRWDGSSGTDNGVAEISTDIDLTAYSSLHIICTESQSPETSVGCRLAVGNRASQYWLTDALAALSLNTAAGTELSVDLSGINGNQDIYLGASAGLSGRYIQLEVTQIWLE